jgi:hypothetical protein
MIRFAYAGLLIGSTGRSGLSTETSMIAQSPDSYIVILFYQLNTN